MEKPATEKQDESLTQQEKETAGRFTEMKKKEKQSFSDCPATFKTGKRPQFIP